MELSEIGEFGLIEKIRGKIGRPGGKVIKGIEDDCAVIESSGEKAFLYTTDILVVRGHRPMQAGKHLTSNQRILLKESRCLIWISGYYIIAFLSGISLVSAY